MLVLLITSLCISLTTGKHIVDKKSLVFTNPSQQIFVWPERYTVKATKMTLTSDLVEDMVAWKTKDTSRVDYNEGAVKSITILRDTNLKYEIHPETNRRGSISLVCHNVSEALPTVSLDTILPPVKDIKFNIIGNETITDIKTTKFEYIGRFPAYGILWKVKLVMWATKTPNYWLWVPVKFESTEFRHELGSVKTHEIWYFSDFSTKFDDSVFEIVDNFNCLKKEMVSHKPDSEKVTKELISVNPENEKHVEHIFNHFKNQYDRQYPDEKEHTLRKMIFLENMRLISTTNRRNLPYKLGINEFADKTIEEMERDHMGLLKRPEGNVGNIPFPYSGEKLKNIVNKLPKEHDLRLLGLVSSVKNQRTCGSCWAFATTAVVEGALARINGGKLMSLSTQALIDCAWGFGLRGCHGGWDHAAYEWMMQFGLPTVEDYGPYKNKEGFCHINNVTRRYPIKGYVNITSYNTKDLKFAVVNHGPLSVSVHVTDKSRFYSRGVYYEDSCGLRKSQLNHEVTLVGYGRQEGQLFWVLKYSYGQEWGEAGYMRISAKDNNCGVATEPTYVVF